VKAIIGLKIGFQKMKLIKRLLCRIGLGSWLTEFCDDCGGKQPLVWWASEPLWLEVTGKDLN